MEQQPLSYVYSMKPGRSYLFAEFLEFICNKLYLGSNDDLYGGLAWTHHASHTGGLDQLFIDLGIILDLKTESGNAVINRSHILRTANAFQNDLRYFREVVIGQSYLGLICIVILTSRSLQIKLGKEKCIHILLLTVGMIGVLTVLFLLAKVGWVAAGITYLTGQSPSRLFSAYSGRLL